MIRHMASPSMPELRFEWHVESRKLYVIFAAETKLVDGKGQDTGHLVATGIEDQKLAELVTNAYIAGRKSR